MGGSPTSLDLLTVDPQPQVPALVSTCCKFLEGHGLHTLGIFRVSSSKKRVRQVRISNFSFKEYFKFYRLILPIIESRKSLKEIKYTKTPPSNFQFLKSSSHFKIGFEKCSLELRNTNPRITVFIT